MTKQEVSVFWFRRDLRIEDNHGLCEALKSPYPVLPIFIFDSNITDELESNDARISFIYQQLSSVSGFLAERSSGLYITKNSPEEAWESIRNEFDVKGVYFNEDELYFQYRIENKEGLDLDINFVKHQIATNYKNSSSNQKLGIEPVFVYKQPKTIAGKSENHFVLVFKKFALDEKNRVIESIRQEWNNEDHNLDHMQILE